MDRSEVARIRGERREARQTARLPNVQTETLDARFAMDGPMEAFNDKEECFLDDFGRCRENSRLDEDWMDNVRHDFGSSSSGEEEELPEGLPEDMEPADKKERMIPLLEKLVDYLQADEEVARAMRRAEVKLEVMEAATELADLGMYEIYNLTRSEVLEELASLQGNRKRKRESSPEVTGKASNV